MCLYYLFSCIIHTWSLWTAVRGHPNITPEGQCNKASWRSAKGKIGGPGEQPAKNRGVAEAAQHCQLPRWRWAGGPRGMSCPPSPSPCHPRPTPALCYLPQATSEKEKLDHLILSSSGPPPSLRTSTLHKRFQELNSCRARHAKNAKRGYKCCTCHASISSSSCVLEAAIRLWTLALEVLYPISPK